MSLEEDAFTIQDSFGLSTIAIRLTFRQAVYAIHPPPLELLPNP